MNSDYTQIKELYQKELLSILKDLEKPRIRVRNLLIVVGSITLILLFFAILYLIVYNVQNNKILEYVVIGTAMGISCVIASLLETTDKVTSYKEEFKKNVVLKIFNIILPEAHYILNGSISESDYKSSHLFPKQYTEYSGDDLVKGKIGNTIFQFSELHTIFKTYNPKGSSSKTRFKGLFFIADFNKNIIGKTFVIPDKIEDIFGTSIASMFQSLNIKYGKLIKLENLEFEKRFAVYADDETNARYILTPKMMERIIELDNKAKKHVLLSFLDNRVYVAIKMTNDLFEPKIFTSGIDIDHIMNIYDILQLGFGIVEDLDLNTRIWTKD